MNGGALRLDTVKLKRSLAGVGLVSSIDFSFQLELLHLPILGPQI
jgi:hypothetical protein